MTVAYSRERYNLIFPRMQVNLTFTLKRDDMPIVQDYSLYKHP